MEELTLLHLLVTSGLFVLIWLVQLCHYPQFSFLDERTFNQAMKHHQRSISYVVMPLMLIELGICIYSAVLGLSQSYILLGLVILIWLSTFVLQVPLHDQLLEGKDFSKIQMLVKTNWVRTILWTVKLFLLLYTL